MTFETSGLNTEHLLNLTAEEGILIRNIERMDERRIRLCVSARQKKAYLELCERYGWMTTIVSEGMVYRIASMIGKRPMILCGLVMYVLLTAMLSNMICQIRIVDAGKNEGEVKRFLKEENVTIGRWMRAISPEKLRDQLLLRLPDLAYVTVGYEGSCLVIDCQLALEGEQIEAEGGTGDLVASQDGLITGIVVKRGTPVVHIGQIVRKGETLIRGEERDEKQSVRVVEAQGSVTARVWVRGDARASRYIKRSVETGAVRRRVTLQSPWHKKVIADDQAFAEQDVSVDIQQVVGLYLPLVRRIETLAEIVIIREERSSEEAFSIAAGAAEQIAKNKCPPGIHILDKSVENSIIDNEYVYAAVVLAYEDSIAIRRARENMICE